MGYSYSSSRGGLCCDNCGNSGGVRKRTCTHKVLGDSLRSRPAGVRHEMPYCQPPALCSPCYHDLKATLHTPCAEGARISQGKADKIEAGLLAGAFFRTAAWGDWHKAVPTGRVGVSFNNREQVEVFYHVESAEYRTIEGETTPEDYPSAVLMPAFR